MNYCVACICIDSFRIWNLSKLKWSRDQCCVYGLRPTWIERANEDLATWENPNLSKSHRFVPHEKNKNSLEFYLDILFYIEISLPWDWSSLTLIFSISVLVFDGLMFCPQNPQLLFRVDLYESFQINNKLISSKTCRRKGFNSGTKPEYTH